MSIKIPTWIIRIAAILLSIPLFVQLWERAHSENATTPTRFTVTVEGQGPDVIMIPGLASSADVWRPAADKLKAHYRVHLIQVSGFAGTPPRANASGPVLAPLRDELDHPTIVGHSLGGLLGLMLADSSPDVVGKLVVVDALPFFGMMMGRPQRLRRSRPPPHKCATR